MKHIKGEMLKQCSFLNNLCIEIYGGNKKLASQSLNSDFFLRIKLYKPTIVREKVNCEFMYYNFLPL